MDIEKAKEELKGKDIFSSRTTENGYAYMKCINEAKETVLNELEKKEAEIDKLRNTNKDLLKKLRNRVKEVKSLTRYSLYKKEFARLNKQLKKKDTVINEYEKECRQFKSFCRRVRRDEKRDVDEFNQGQELKCNQFLNLLYGEAHWSYEGKYFDETDKQVDKLFKKAEEK